MKYNTENYFYQFGQNYNGGYNNSAASSNLEEEEDNNIFFLFRADTKTKRLVIRLP